MCGEQYPITLGEIYDQGSPPRVRGTGGNLTKKWTISRITPACAGNSYSHIRRFQQAKDHPRVCGEQQTNCAVKSGRLGSPPRVRGTGLRA